MAPLRVERTPGGSPLGVTRAQLPAALRLPPLLLLLLLLGGERSVRPGCEMREVREGKGPGPSRPARDHPVSPKRSAEPL